MEFKMLAKIISREEIFFIKRMKFSIGLWESEQNERPVSHIIKLKFIGNQAYGVKHPKIIMLMAYSPI